MKFLIENIKYDLMHPLIFKYVCFKFSHITLYIFNLEVNSLKKKSTTVFKPSSFGSAKQNNRDFSLNYIF